MKKYLCAIAAVSLLGACAEEAEVVDENAIADTEVNSTALEAGSNGAWDSNADGLFQEAEYTSLGSSFTTWDSDADGFLSDDEFEAGWTQTGWNDSEGAFAAFDDDGDGVLSNDEFFSDDEWSEWDANDDGVLDESEWTF